MNHKLILALDLEDKSEVFAVLKKLGKEIEWVKVGLQLFLKYGPTIVEELSTLGYKIFLDLKLNDIPNTVFSAIRSLRDLNVQMLTVHCNGGKDMLSKALEAQKTFLPDALLLGVSVLTSFNQQALQGVGVHKPIQEQVLGLIEIGVAVGLTGFVCSPLELLFIREKQKDLTLVTPGIRALGAESQDQQRTLTAKQAFEAGASYIVVGRPIIKAVDPLLAVQSFHFQ
jgi:orotidine-5'-phosphate decarboxylase